MNLSFYSSFMNNLANQESQITTLQQQISTGTIVQTAAQNPAAYETSALATDQINQLNNAATTQSAIQTQLGTATSAYGSVLSLLDNVQSVVEQGLNGTSNTQNMDAFAQQVQSASQQLLSLGNTQLPNGNYLFGGTRGGVTPFQVGTDGTVSYYGDSGQSQANIDEGTLANTLVNGSVFTTALSGDGTSVVAASSSNTGSAQLLQTGLANVQDANTFQQSGSDITVSFSEQNGNMTYTASQNGQTIKQGPLSAGSNNQDLTLGGVNYQISGAPASGDTFTISPARPQTAFSLLQKISSALSAAGSTPAQRAQSNQILNQSLAGLGQYQQLLTTAQAQNGVTLQALSNAQTNVSAQKSAAQTTISNATAVNMPAAITALNQTMSAVEASMKTFAEAQNLDLFKYL